MDSPLTSMEVDKLRALWGSIHGMERRRQVLRDRFNLGSISKISEVAANESLSRDLRGIDLSNEQLSKFMLLEVDLSWARFAFAKVDGPFQETLLNGCDFTGSRIGPHSCFWMCKGSNTVFDHASLSGARFEGSVLPGVSFADAVLSEVDFLSWDLMGADFSRATVHGCSFRKTRLDARWRSMLEAANASLDAVDWA